MMRDIRLILKLFRHFCDGDTAADFAELQDFNPDHTTKQTPYHLDFCIETVVR